METLKKLNGAQQFALSLVFAAVTLVICLAGLLPAKQSVASTQAQASKSAAEQASRQSSALKSEEWSRLVKAL